MEPRICMGCGEPLAENGDAHSRNPNTCASCSSLSDGMPESGLSSFPDFDDKMQGEVDDRDGRRSSSQERV
jgi:hypothetical protein